MLGSICIVYLTRVGQCISNGEVQILCTFCLWNIAASFKTWCTTTAHRISSANFLPNAAKLVLKENRNYLDNWFKIAKGLNACYIMYDVLKWITSRQTQLRVEGVILSDLMTLYRVFVLCWIQWWLLAKDWNNPPIDIIPKYYLLCYIEAWWITRGILTFIYASRLSKGDRFFLFWSKTI